MQVLRKGDINLEPEHVIRPKLLTRRKFLRAITSFFLFILLKPHKYSYASGKKRKEFPLGSGDLLKGKFESFTQYQATVVEEVTSLIIPTDADPGAREAGVVFELDRNVANSEELKELYEDGTEWLDYMAMKTSDKESFLGLSHNEKINILRLADSARFSYIYKVYLFIRYRVSGTVRKYFYTIQKQTIEAFYTSKTGWKVVGYQGPPQWSGHLDYHKCT
jgi:hypothetical protein